MNVLLAGKIPELGILSVQLLHTVYVHTYMHAVCVCVREVRDRDARSDGQLPLGSKSWREASMLLTQVI